MTIDLDAIQACSAPDCALAVRSKRLCVSPALVAEVRHFRELVRVLNHRVLSGDPDDIEAALEALPVGSVVRSSDEAIRDREARIWVREDAPDDAAWSGTGRAARPAGYLARYCAPLTVIA